MPIEFRWKTKRILLLAIVFALGTGCRLWATTVEVENEDDDISVASTPTPQTMKPQVTPQNGKTLDADLEMEGESKAVLPPSLPTPITKKRPLETPTPTVVSAEIPIKNESSPNSSEPFRSRVRISDKVGFYYFVSASFLVSDPAQIHSIGKVIGSSDESLNFSTPKKTYIELSSDINKVKPDDLLVVFRSVIPIHEPRSSASGYQIENLAIVKVVEIQKRRVLVEVKDSFGPFQDGDRVESYENEIKRWKQAQIKKELPAHAIRSFVLGGNLGRQNYEQTDFIYLSAGTKTGVVEGQNFELRQLMNTGAMEEPIHAPQGLAQVIFAGPNFSTAQIINNNGPIQKSFEAIYQP